MGFRGINVLQDGDKLLFRASLKSSAGAKVSAGTTELRLYELQSDATIKWFDFNDNTFKTGTPSDDETTLTHRQYTDDGGSGQDTGLWTGLLNTVSGFTLGGLYVAQVTNTNAFPESQEFQFQYGLAEGNLIQDLVASIHGAKTWYVATTGASGNDGLSWQTPKLDLRATIQGAAAGDVVRVGPGTWNLAGLQIIWPAGVTVIGSGAGRTIITTAIGTSTCYLDSYCRFRRATVINTFGTESTGMRRAIDCPAAATGMWIEDVDTESQNGLGIRLRGSDHVVRGGFHEASEYCIYVVAKRCLIEDIRGHVDGWDTCRASVIGMGEDDDASAIVRNSIGTAERSAGGDRAIGLWCFQGRLVAVDCQFEGLGATTDDGIGAEAGWNGVASYGDLTLIGGRYHGLSGSGNSYDVSKYHASAQLYFDSGVGHDSSKLNGSPINLSSRAADLALDWANGIETGVTHRQALQRMGAGVAGDLSGAGTGTEVMKGMDNSTTRLTVTADAAGNRTVVYN